LVDRATFPRDKLCGDTLNPGSLALLSRHALTADVRARALPITGMTVTGPGASVSSDYPGGLCGVSLARRDLDALLAQAAVAAGACLEEEITALGAALDRSHVIGIRTTERPGVRHARIVIAADGRASRIGGSVGLTTFARRPRRWAFGAYFEGVDGLTTRGEMHIRPNGYVGIAPLPGGLANLCVVRELRNGGAVDQNAVLRQAVSSDPVLQGRFRRARQVTPLAVLGPLAVDARSAGLPGLLLAGDAAGFVDPMTGDGLYFALRGAELAAEAALAELRTGRPSCEWLQTARMREFHAKWRINRALRALVGSPRALGVAARVARRWPAPVEYLVGLAGDVRLAQRAAAHQPLAAHDLDPRAHRPALPDP
jgi:flavin-dependent dehydrogenase